MLHQLIKKRSYNCCS